MAFFSNEILLLIAENLHGALPSGTLLSLCRCSHHFYDLFSPILYSRIYFEPCVHGGCLWCDGKCFRKISTVVQTLYRKPNLAGHVKHLDLLPWHTEEPSDSEDSDSDSDEKSRQPIIDEALLHTVLNKVCLDPEEQPEWMDHLRRGNLDAWVALLLPALPNLQTLVFSPPEDDDPVYFLKTLLHLVNGKIQVNNTPALSKLHSVSLIRLAQENGEDAICAVPFFKVPSLRKVSGVFVTDPWDRSVQRWTDGLDIMPHSSSVTELEVDYGTSDEGMACWTKLCKRLESFEVQFGDRSCDRSMDCLRIFDFLESLADFKTSLRNLRIDYSIDSTYQVDEDFYAVQEAGSFKDFCVLEDLHVRLPCLLQIKESQSAGSPPHLTDVLPASLQTLHICECREVDIPMLISEVTDLLSQKAAYVPDLKMLKVSCCPKPGTDVEDPVVLTPEIQNLLQALCQAVSVEFIQGGCGSGYGFHCEEVHD